MAYIITIILGMAIIASAQSTIIVPPNDSYPLVGTGSPIGLTHHTVVSTTTVDTNPQTLPSPNIVIILTDDQDSQLDSLSYTPLIRKHLMDQGTFFRRHYCTTAICCPSRVSLWTGRAAHNTNVTNVSPPYGGYPKFISQGFNDRWLPVWLQDFGYNTYYAGKLFNALTIQNYNSPYPNGFTGSDFLLDPYTYQYLNGTFQRNRDQPVSYEGQYSTDVVAEKSYGFLDEAIENGKPFFLAIAPIAPHSNMEFDSTSIFGAPIPAKRHELLFKNVIVPRTESFNPEKPSGASWIHDLTLQTQSNIDYNDYYYRSRLRALQAVDELVDGIVSSLEANGILNNTYIIYTSDNGFHIGQHRLQPGKECGYEEDINVPLIIRGPNVPLNHVSDIVTTHTDLAPTIFSILGNEPRADFDGAPIPFTAVGIEKEEIERHEHVNVEYWGDAFSEGKYSGYDRVGNTNTGTPLNNTYKSLRIIGKTYSFYYSVWCNNDHELYDLNADPYQMNNLLLPSFPIPLVLSHPLDKVVSRLDALLLVLKSCKSETCIKPWTVLHPKGDVKDLQGALRLRYDKFYEEQIKIEFTRCEPGYIIDAEGPQQPRIYGESLE